MPLEEMYEQLKSHYVIIYYIIKIILEWRSK